MENPTSEELEHQPNDLASFFKDNVTHVVVEFVHEKTLNDKASIELVPREWLDRVDEQWICYYPPKKDWSKVDYWTKISKSRERLWKGSEIRILKEAANYEKGLRRLKKFFTDDAVLSTGEDIPVETKTQGNHLRILSAAESQFELEDLPSMISVAASIALNETASPELASVENRPSNSLGLIEKRVQRGQSRGETYCNDSIERSRGVAGAVGNALGAIDLATVVSQIQLSERRILREIETVKRSILYDAQARADEVKNTVMVNSVSSLSTNISQHTEHLGFELPCKTVDIFEAFDAAIAADREKRKSLDCIMTKYTIGNIEFTPALSSILSSLLCKDVQLQYSACGREIRGIKKKNFSETQTFKCLDAVLTEKYSISTKTITSKMSRWFIGAGDRGGGRKQRK